MYTKIKAQLLLGIWVPRAIVTRLAHICWICLLGVMQHTWWQTSSVANSLPVSNAFVRCSLKGDVNFSMWDISNVDLCPARQLHRVRRAGVTDCFRKPFALPFLKILWLLTDLSGTRWDKQDACEHETQQWCCRGGSYKRPLAQAGLMASTDWFLLLPCSSKTRGQQPAAECRDSHESCWLHIHPAPSHARRDRAAFSKASPLSSGSFLLGYFPFIYLRQ